jgi:PAS domain S-box-containing protein
MDMQDAEHTYRILAQHLPGSMIYVLDRELHVMFAGGGLAGGEGSQLAAQLGQTLRDVVSPDLYRQAELRLQTALDGHHSQFTLTSQAGAKYQVQATPLRQGGNVAALLVLVVAVSEQQRTEEAQRMAQDRLRLAVQAANVGLWDWHLQSNTVRYSPEWKHMLGYADDEVDNRLEEWERLVHPDDLPHARSTVMRYVAAPWPNFQQEFRMRHKDGSYRWILAQGALSYDAEGIATHMLGSHIDITAQKEHETALRTSEEALKRSQEVAHVGHWTWDTRSNTVTWSDEMKRIFGLDPQAFSGDLSAVIDHAIHPDDAERVRALNARVLHDQEPIAAEYRVVWPDGSIHYVWATPADRICDAQGQIIQLSGVVQDVTLRRQGELERELLLLELSDKAEQLAQVMRSVPEGVLLLDIQGRVLLANRRAEELLSVLCTPEQLEGERQLTQLGDRLLDELLTSPPVGQWHRAKVGRRSFELLARPLEGGPVPGGSVMVLRDVTAELAVEEQLHRQERLAAVGQLAAGIAHDFNNIMSVVTIYAELLGETPGLTSQERARAATIMVQADRATRMIRQILDFSRKSVLERQVLDLLPLLKEQEKLLKDILPENIDVQLISEPRDYLVKADPTRMQQLIMNLALNARDAMPQGGDLHIRLTVGDDPSLPKSLLLDADVAVWLRIDVQDTGTGIAAENLAHVFEPFFTTKEPGKGTGLGLAQAHGIVAQHGGGITVTSELGVGTTVTVFLPAYTLPVQQPLERQATAAQRRGRGQHILLVEDNDALRISLQELLASWNYQVTAVANGEEALAHIAQKLPADVILSDVVMPRLGGSGVLRALRRQNIHTPVILMSGHVLGEEREALAELGARACLQKPVPSEQLAAALADALADTLADTLADALADTLAPK